MAGEVCVCCAELETGCRRPERRPRGPVQRKLLAHKNSTKP